MSTETHFINELGNTIHIQVEEQEIQDHPGILITITGPDSTSTNHITCEEAEVLQGLLSKTLHISNSD